MPVCASGRTRKPSHHHNYARQVSTSTSRQTLPEEAKPQPPLTRQLLGSQSMRLRPSSSGTPGHVVTQRVWLYASPEASMPLFLCLSAPCPDLYIGITAATSEGEFQNMRGLVIATSEVSTNHSHLRPKTVYCRSGKYLFHFLCLLITIEKLSLNAMAKKGRIHWFGPVSMLAALFAGIGFALGHHFFYGRLDGKEIPAGNYTMGDYNSGISRQQSNTAVGTALAFAVKTCLVLAVSTAYVQLFWKSLIQQSSSQSYNLQSIDMAYSALRNATLLANFSGWRRFPLLFTLAITTW